MKSEGLRDVLRAVLEDVKGICLQEEKPSVEQSLLFHYLSDLEAYRSSNAALNDSTLRHLDLLLDFIKKPYESTTKRLTALLQKREITFNLLWAFFKPSTIVYTTCVGTGKPRCIKWPSEVLSHLQIPQKKKTAIYALLEAHMKRASSSSFSFNDFIVGKGLGSNVLMQYSSRSQGLIGLTCILAGRQVQARP